MQIYLKNRGKIKTFSVVQKFKKLIASITSLQGSPLRINKNDTSSKSGLAQKNEVH